MKILLKFNLIILLFIPKFFFCQTEVADKLNLMQNSLLLGFEEKGIEIAIEIISKEKYSSVKEKALFTIAEYFFAEGILGNKDENTRIFKGDFQYINKSYTFYLKLLKQYPEGEYSAISKQRIDFLEYNYKTDLIFRSLDNYIENERIIVQKKLNFANLFIDIEKENPFLFFSRGDDANTFELITKYLDDIIVNNPSHAIYSYYYKLLLVLSQKFNIDLIKGKFEESSLSQQGSIKNKEIVEEATKILTLLNEKFPEHPLTIQSYLVAVSYLIKANIWEYDSKEVKKWLEIALKDDNDKLGLKHLVTKEYILKTEFED